MAMEHETSSDEIAALLNDDDSIDGRRALGRLHDSPEPELDLDLPPDDMPSGKGKVSAKRCAAWRTAVREQHARRSHLAAQAPFEISGMAVGNHVGGDCSHEHDVPPVGDDDG